MATVLGQYKQYQEGLLKKISDNLLKTVGGRGYSDALTGKWKS